MTNTKQYISEDKCQHARENGAGWLASIEEMIAAYEDAKDDDAREDAERTIHESPLSVEVRSGWIAPGNTEEGMMWSPDEYNILLSTGGPALRIIGRLDAHCEPESAELQCQDWFLPWARCDAPEATLLRFAQFFWYGE